MNAVHHPDVFADCCIEITCFATDLKGVFSCEELASTEELVL